MQFYATPHMLIRERYPKYLFARKFRHLTGITVDALAVMLREGLSLFSMLFGNAVGLVETRKGKLYNNKNVFADVAANLEAGDILLEKTPFRLTDKLIPGYWGHAAIWIGSEAELKNLGIWDNPVVVNFRDKIREGKMVVEALRSGVEMNTLERFLNIDSVGILRKPGQSQQLRANCVLQALRQVGKPYDFNFDVEPNGGIFCSKLVYHSYIDIDWETKNSLGRTTFTPDDVALKAASDGTLQLVTFYHDGMRVNKAPELLMAKLIGVG